VILLTDRQKTDTGVKHTGVKHITSLTEFKNAHRATFHLLPKRRHPLG